MARLQMQVIAPVQRLLAVGSNVSPQVVLIGRLVIRESRVAIEAVGAVLHAQMGNRRVEPSNPSNRQLHAILKVCPDSIFVLHPYVIEKVVQLFNLESQGLC